MNDAIEDGIKLGQIKQEFIDANDPSLKEDVEKDETAENENSGDEQDEGKEGIIKITLSDLNVVASTSQPPSETQVSQKENSVNEDNEMVLIVKTKNKTDKSEPTNETELKINLDGFPKLATSMDIEIYEGNIETFEELLKDAKTNFINANNSQDKKQFKKDINFYEDELKVAKKELENYLKEYDTEIKVEAYFTKSKNKTRVKQTFTITEKGIN